jgi:response regulator RpfG family c-di-GMP phosphodiesterase
MGFIVDPLKQTILLVEDDVSILKLLEFILKKDYNVICAINGRDALEKITSNKPSLIISDIMMPEMNGIELKKELNIKSETSKIPFIFMTAISDKNTRQVSQELGVSEYIIKPAKPGDIKEKVKKILN